MFSSVHKNPVICMNVINYETFRKIPKLSDACDPIPPVKVNNEGDRKVIY